MILATAAPAVPIDGISQAASSSRISTWRTVEAAYNFGLSKGKTNRVTGVAKASIMTTTSNNCKSLVAAAYSAP